MKRVIGFIIGLGIGSVLFAQDSGSASVGAEFDFTVPVLLAILAGCYEVISRIIPTTKTWSIVGKVLEVLTWLSNLFDRKKKK